MTRCSSQQVHHTDVSSALQREFSSNTCLLCNRTFVFCVRRWVTEPTKIPCRSDQLCGNGKRFRCWSVKRSELILPGATPPVSLQGTSASATAVLQPRTGCHKGRITSSLYGLTEHLIFFFQSFLDSVEIFTLPCKVTHHLPSSVFHGLLSLKMTPACTPEYESFLSGCRVSHASSEWLWWLFTFVFYMSSLVIFVCFHFSGWDGLVLHLHDFITAGFWGETIWCNGLISPFSFGLWCLHSFLSSHEESLGSGLIKSSFHLNAVLHCKLSKVFFFARTNKQLHCEKYWMQVIF